MTGPDALSLDGISLLLVWTAIATYLLAFVAYTIDLAQRSVPANIPQREPLLVGAAAAAMFIGRRGVTAGAAGTSTADQTLQAVVDRAPDGIVVVDRDHAAGIGLGQLVEARRSNPAGFGRQQVHDRRHHRRGG